LESGLRSDKAELQNSAGRKRTLPSDVMEKLVTHRVDPEYPCGGAAGQTAGSDRARRDRGRDGSDLDEEHALNGPEILSAIRHDALRWWRFKPYRVAWSGGWWWKLPWRWSSNLRSGLWASGFRSWDPTPDAAFQTRRLRSAPRTMMPLYAER